MATVIFGGSRELNLLISGEPHQDTLNYLSNQASRIAQYAQETGSAWAQRAVDSYNYFSSHDSLRHARAALQKVKSYFQSDIIRELRTIEDFQNATPLMQRYIMADPWARKMYHAGRVEGYAGLYIDPYPGVRGIEDYNYRRVMDGRVQMLPESEENPEGSFFIETHYGDLQEGDVDLSLNQQDMIISSWRNARYLALIGLDDPYSSTGGKL